MKKVRLWKLAILLGASAAVATGCAMVKPTPPKEKLAGYEQITDLYYYKYGSHGTFESLPGEPFKLSLTIYRDVMERAKDFMFTTGEYCNAIGGKIETNGNKFTCSSAEETDKVLFVTRSKVTKAYRIAGDSSEKALMEIWVDQNNSKAFDREKGSLPDSRPGQSGPGLTPADLHYMKSLGL